MTGTRTRPARDWVETIDMRTWTFSGAFRTIAPGQRSIDVKVTLDEDDAVSVAPEGQMIAIVTVTADRDVVVDGPVGMATAPPGPMPTLDVVDASATATPGSSLRWELRLSSPTVEGVVLPATFTAVGSELRAEDVVPSWLRVRGLDPAVAGPLSRTVGATSVEIPSAQTSVIVELPVRRTASVGTGRNVRLVVDRSAVGASDLVLTGKVLPGR